MAIERDQQRTACFLKSIITADNLEMEMDRGPFYVVLFGAVAIYSFIVPPVYTANGTRLDRK